MTAAPGSAPGTHRVTSPPAMGGMVSPAAGSIGLSGAFFAAANVYLLMGALGLVWIAPALASWNYLSPHVAGVTHFFTLGWITTTIFGALYQLLPVALGAPIHWPRVAQASWWTFVPGVALFAGGVATQATGVYHAGAGLVAIGIVLVTINVAWSLAHAPRRDPTRVSIAIAFVFLLSTLGLGLALAHNLSTGILAAARVRILVTHLHLAIVGWVLMLIVGISHRLLPMFMLAHGADTRWSARALALFAVGLVALAAGLNVPFTPLEWVGAASLVAGLSAFAAQARAFHRVRVRKKLDVGLRFAGVALGSLCLAAILGVVLLALGVQARGVAEAYVISGLVGGVTLYVVGFSYKIIPLLVWTAAYRDRMGTGQVPVVAAMYSTPTALVQLGLMAGGIALLVVSVLIAQTQLAYVAAGTFLAGDLVFVAQFIRVALHLTRRSSP